MDIKKHAVLPICKIRPVLGYEGRYEVTNYGKVISFCCNSGERGKGRVLSRCKDRQGYIKYHISKDKKMWYTKAHTLVMEAFSGIKRPKGMQVRHLDGNCTNNYVGNLAWGSPKDNCQDAIGHGTWTRGERQGLSRLKDDQVREIKRRLANGEKGAVIGRDYGVSRFLISAIKTGASWGWLTDF